MSQTTNERQTVVRQETYNMHEETGAFLKGVDVKELPYIPDEWQLVPIESDKLTNWVKQNS